MPTPVNSRIAAELVNAALSKLDPSEGQRSCSRQNLEKLAEKGALKDSRCVLHKKPYQFDRDTVASEYLAKVSPTQAGVSQPTARLKTEPKPLDQAQRPKAACHSSHPEKDDGEIPPWHISRARTEYEKANLLELDRRKKEGELLVAAEVEQAMDMERAIVRSALLGAPSQYKAEMPELEAEQIERMREINVRIWGQIAELKFGGGDGEQDDA